LFNVNDTGQAPSVAGTVLGVANQYRLPLEEGAADRLLGQVHQAMGARTEADAAFRRSLDILGNIQCRPELAQSCWPMVASAVATTC
jgi:hypothetical protein